MSAVNKVNLYHHTLFRYNVLISYFPFCSDTTGKLAAGTRIARQAASGATKVRLNHCFSALSFDRAATYAREFAAWPAQEWIETRRSPLPLLHRQIPRTKPSGDGVPMYVLGCG